MNAEWVGVVVLVVLSIMMLTGLPVTFCLLFISAVGFLELRGVAATQLLFISMFSTLTKDILMAIPLFVFMACLLEVSGIGAALYEMFYRWMSGLRGGLAIATIAVATVMAAMTGSVATATVTMGLLAYPEMKRRGYDKRLMLGCIPAGGALGPLIPPSIMMIVVASVTSVSIGKLFIAGVVPGLLTAGLFMVYIGILCWMKPQMGPSVPLAERPSFKEKVRALRLAILPISLIVLVLGMIYAGIATPTEAGGVGAFGALVCTAIYRNLTFVNLQAVVMRSFRLSAVITWLLISAYMFASLVGMLGITGFFVTFVTGLNLDPWLFVLLVLVIVFVLGMFMDTGPIAVILLPIFMPVVLKLGIDPLWFCLLFTIDMIVGTLTPPFGMTLFIMKGLGITGVSMMDIYRSIIPFVLAMLAALVLCAIFPSLVLWLPEQMLG